MPTPDRLSRIQQMLNDSYNLLFSIQKAQLVAQDPVEKLRLEYELADTLRRIEQFESQHKKLEEQPQLATPRPQSGGNPFNRIGVVSSEFFIGREVKLRRIKMALDDGNSIILIGERKTGKSSFMRRLYETYVKEGWQVVFFDFIEPVTLRDHYAALTRKLGASGDTYQDVKAALEGKSVILFLDEFDLAPERGLDADQLGGLQSLARNAELKFRVVATSIRPAKEIYAGYKMISLPYAFLQIEQLAKFNETECHLLLETYLTSVQRPALFSPESRAELVQLGEGHPFKLMRAACRLYEALTDPDPEEDWKAAFKFDVDNMM